MHSALHNINLHDKNLSSYNLFPNMSYIKNKAHTIKYNIKRK